MSRPLRPSRQRQDESLPFFFVFFLQEKLFSINYLLTTTTKLFRCYCRHRYHRLRTVFFLNFIIMNWVPCPSFFLVLFFSFENGGNPLRGYHCYSLSDHDRSDRRPSLTAHPSSPSSSELNPLLVRDLIFKKITKKSNEMKQKNATGISLGNGRAPVRRTCSSY